MSNVIIESINNRYRDKIFKIKDGFVIKNEKGEVVSSVKYYEFDDIDNFDWILICDMETVPEYRGRGYATRLLNKVYSEAISRNKGVYLLVKEDNENAINLYKKLGFEKIKNQDIDKKRHIVMCKGNKDKQQLLKMNFS